MGAQSQQNRDHGLGDRDKVAARRAEVARLRSEGLKNRAIADALGIPYGMVRLDACRLRKAGVVVPRARAVAVPLPIQNGCRNPLYAKLRYDAGLPRIVAVAACQQAPLSAQTRKRRPRPVLQAFSIGAEIRALYPQQRGAACQGRPSDTLQVLSEVVGVHAPNIGHGARECPGQKLPESFSA
jgi:hypothetical protein